MHSHCRVLIILGLDVLGQADLVGTPVEYDKVAPSMQHPSPAGGPPQYLNGQGRDLSDLWCSTYLLYAEFQSPDMQLPHVSQCCKVLL